VTLILFAPKNAPVGVVAAPDPNPDAVVAEADAALEPKWNPPPNPVEAGAAGAAVGGTAEGGAGANDEAPVVMVDDAPTPLPPKEKLNPVAALPEEVLRDEEDASPPNEKLKLPLDAIVVLGSLSLLIL